MYLAQIILFVSLAVRISNEHLPAKLMFQMISFLSLGGHCTAEVGLVAGVGEISAEISAAAECSTVFVQCPLHVSAGILMCIFPKVRKCHPLNPGGSCLTMATQVLVELHLFDAHITLELLWL